MEGIEISQTKVGTRRDIALLAVKGYVDTMTCSILLNKIIENLNQGSLHVIIDMGQVNYVSSAGWGVFVGEIKGIRERGGDLKLVQMTPEVIDVFEMLEFNRILNHYDSLEEAINDFDISIGLDITKSVKRSYAESEAAATAAVENEADLKQVFRPQRSTPQETGGSKSFGKSARKPVDKKLLPLNEKIKQAVVENPNRGAWAIKKALSSPAYGNTNIGFFKVRNILKELNLENKDKRFRYYRSR